MPKDDHPRLSCLREQRLAKRARMDVEKRKKGGAVSGAVAFQALGNGDALLLYTDQDRVLFNCGEGTQRIVAGTSPPRALAQLSNLFFTSRRWRRLGGFPGMCLTVRAAGAPDVTVRGPGGDGGGMPRFFEAVRHFILLQDFEVRPGDASRPYEDDGTMKVESVPLHYSGPDVVPEVLARDEWNLCCPEEKNDASPFAPLDQTALAYVITVRGKPGRLLVDKCQRLGVPKGPLLGLLKAGEDVTLEDGRIIRSAEVTANPLPDQTCLVLECPTEHHLGSLLAERRLNEDLPRREGGGIPFVFHFTPESVLSSREYREWMGRFPEEEGTKHVILNERSAEFSSRDVLAYGAKMRTIAPALFPDLAQVNAEDVRAIRGRTESLPANVVIPVNGQKFVVRPEPVVGERPEEFQESAVQNELEEAEGFHRCDSRNKRCLEQNSFLSLFHRSLKDLREKQRAVDSSGSLPSYPKVTFLGTGASIPSKYRCVSGILAELTEDKFAIFDCGEGKMISLPNLVPNQQRTLNKLPTEL